MALSDNLQGWWCPSLDTAGNGTTTLTDLSGNGNNGTLTNMDAATDWVADTDSGGVRALNLDGINDAVSLPTIPVASLQTVSVWVKFAALPATLTLAFSSRDPMRVYLGQANGTGYIRVGSDLGNLGGSVSLSTTAWVHLVAVTADDGLSYTGYINGVSVGSRATTLSATTNTGLGAYFLNPNQPIGNFLSGLLNSVAVYSRALTADEVTQLYNGGRSLNLLASGGSGNIAHVLRSIQQQHESVVTL